MGFKVPRRRREFERGKDDAGDWVVGTEEPCML